jgi:hypothetical protein
VPFTEGSHALTATYNGSVDFSGSPSTGVTQTVNALATKLAFSIQPGNGVSTTSLSTQPSVVVQDSGGSTVTTVTSPVTIAITNPSGAVLTCTANPKSAVSGVASYAGCSVDKAGTYTLTASSPGLTSAVSTTFTVTAGAATRLLFTDSSGLNQTCAAGSLPVGNGGQLQTWVTVADAYGNPVTGSARTVTLTKGAGGGDAPSPGTLSVASGAAVTGGASTFKLPVGNPGDTTYTATSPSLSSTSCIIKK